MEMAENTKPEGALDRFFNMDVKFRTEALLCIFLVIVAIFTRFYDLESRVMSHDESLHTYYSWRFLEHQDYKHLPMMHGPLQFHLVGLSYFLFGDSDASSRYPAAILGIASVVLIWFFRKWLGRWGTIFGMMLMVISPYMLYYQRYVRNEALVVFEALLMFLAVFSYFETRQSKWLYLLSFSLTLHYATKETSFIYALQLMAFLGIFFSWDVLRRSWSRDYWKITFLIGLVATVIGVSVAGYALLGDSSGILQDPALHGEPLDPSASGLTEQTGGVNRILALGGVGGLFGVLLMFVVLFAEFGSRLRNEFPTLDLLIVSVTMTLPLLAGIPAKILDLEPLAQNTSVFKTPTGVWVIILMLLSAAIGLAWDWRRWLVAAAVFYGPFIVLYTSLFTNGYGLSSGLVSSLEYWILQHGEERGGQPWFYYLLVQIPIYEYLLAIGSFVAAGFGLKSLIRKIFGDSSERIRTPKITKLDSFPVILFMGYWGLTSLLAYSFAGERMPWLSVHIALPLIFLAGWAFGKWVESVDWSILKSSRGWIVFGLILITYFAFMKAFGIFTGPAPPFAGNEQDQLERTTAFLAALAFGIGGLVALYFSLLNVRIRSVLNIAGSVVLATLIILTVRTSIRASFQNYDQATEYLVYAHSASGVKTILDQVEEYSLRTTGDLAVDVGYDDDVSWPFTWYFRNYPQRHYFGANPSRDITDYPMVIAGGSNYSKVDPILGRKYIAFEYIRMWWPNQDYFSLTWDRVKEILTDRNLRRAVWEIWLNRDYTAYGEITSKDLSLENWSPSDKMKFYIRKDVATVLWDYGVVGAASPDLAYIDPYAERMVSLETEKVIGHEGNDPSGFASPRSIAFAADGSFYVADSKNHRIQYFSADGVYMNEWGSFGETTDQAPAPPGTFNEPWGVAVAPDGTVWVADTWNHRIQHFTAEGEFINTFGRFAIGYEADTFYGPRSIVVDEEGRVFVVDTGNKRVAVLDEDGNLLGQFGGTEIGLAQLNEPVGIALDDEGLIYVADTWNQRVVVFQDAGDGVFRALREWQIDGWWSESLENKPYIAISPSSMVCVSDPEGYRILCFDLQGSFRMGWGDFGYDFTTFNLPTGLAFSPDGYLWVSDSMNNRLMRFEVEQ
jgi:uncharacterized protein (TIGR03663 family)